jgi:hypothetical protein
MLPRQIAGILRHGVHLTFAVSPLLQMACPLISLIHTISLCVTAEGTHRRHTKYISYVSRPCQAQENVNCIMRVHLVSAAAGRIIYYSS